MSAGSGVEVSDLGVFSPGVLSSGLEDSSSSSLELELEMFIPQILTIFSRPSGVVKTDMEVIWPAMVDALRGNLLSTSVGEVIGYEGE